MSIKNFSPQGDPVTPFNSTVSKTQRMQLEHFDLICGHFKSENRILRFVVVISVLAFFVSIAITLYAVSLPESIPVLVTMNDFGETQYVGAVSRRNYQNYSVPEVAIQYQIKEFVSLYYTLSTDRAVMRKSLKKAYALLTQVTATKFTALIKEEKLYDDFSEKTREVVFQSDPLQLSSDTYQVDFQVTTRSLSGATRDKSVYRAVCTVKTMTPAEEDIKLNPLGIYITAFDFKKISNSLSEK